MPVGPAARGGLEVDLELLHRSPGLEHILECASRGLGARAADDSARASFGEDEPCLEPGPVEAAVGRPLVPSAEVRVGGTHDGKVVTSAESTMVAFGDAFDEPDLDLRDGRSGHTPPYHAGSGSIPPGLTVPAPLAPPGRARGIVLSDPDLATTGVLSAPSGTGASRVPPMRLLIATKNYLATWTPTSGLQKFLVDETSDPVSYYYGLTQDPETGATYSAYTRPDERCELWRLSSTLERRKRVLLWPGKPLSHQILLHDGEMWICRCDTDAVEVRSLDGFDLIRTWRPYPGRNHLHINSVNVIDGRVYVCAHNLGRRPGEVFVGTPALEHLGVMSVGSCIHNCWPDPHGRGLYVLSSEESRVYCCEPALRRIISLPSPGFLRGVAATETYTAVGVSTFGERGVRWSFDAEILVLDPTWRLITRIKLPRAGQVYEIRAIGHPDVAHAGKTMHLESEPPKEPPGNE